MLTSWLIDWLADLVVHFMQFQSSFNWLIDWLIDGWMIDWLIDWLGQYFFPHFFFQSRFDRPPHYCSYLQSKGRARAKQSQFIVLASEQEAESVRTDLNGFDAMDEIIRQTCVERNVPTHVEQQLHFEDRPGDMFQPPGSDATVTLTSALSFLQR